MTITQLECFIAAVENKTFFEAAETLHITQSALSKQIISLERELDLQLFDRSGRLAVLTIYGTQFYKDVPLVLSAYRKSLRNLKNIIQNKSSLSLGTLPFLTQYNLTAKLNHFQTEHPDIHLNIHEVEDRQLIAGFLKHDYDVIITRTELLQNISCITHTITTDRLVVLLPADHTHANDLALELGVLKDEPFVLMPEHTSIHNLSVNACQAAGFMPHINRSARAESIISAVAAGEGISLILEKNLQIFQHHNLAAVPLVPPVLSSVVFAYSCNFDQPSLANRLFTCLL